MELLIIVFLLIIILLLLLLLLDRKFSINFREKDIDDRKSNLSSILGETKQVARQILPTNVIKGQYESNVLTKDNFESETIDKEVERVGESKNLEDILVKNEEWEEQEEDWTFQASSIESGFATGVTFQELSTVDQLLQQDILEADLEQQAVDIIQRIQGTELFELLENSLGDASKRIAILLRESISNDDQTISSKRNNSVDGFDIGEFI
ncbi:hypothetical protein [Chryseobacterium indologenes]|uniref:hypothetical protein n=1 Tax=Chryseobacterium indologenes TaxID=253 RepID=UPI00076E4979|nr:hypothetical protein [Chryseobacterium indologenes]